MEGNAVAWGIPIVLYIFLGGLAGGSYFIASLADIMKVDESGRLSKIGFWVAFVSMVLGVIFLIADLGSPGRFYRVLTHFRLTSPMSVGSWGVVAFTFFSVLSLLMAYGEEGEGLLCRLGYWLSTVIPKGAVDAIGLSVSVFLATYTGVLLMETSRPLWSDTPFLGALFLCSGISTAVAVISIFYARVEEVSVENERSLGIIDNIAIFVELVIVLFMAVQLRPVNRTLFSGVLAFAFWFLVVFVGLVIPFIINLVLVRKMRMGRVFYAATFVSSILVLIGGIVLRYIIVMGGQI